MPSSTPGLAACYCSSYSLCIPGYWKPGALSNSGSHAQSTQCSKSLLLLIKVRGRNDLGQYLNKIIHSEAVPAMQTTPVFIVRIKISSSLHHRWTLAVGGMSWENHKEGSSRSPPRLLLFTLSISRNGSSRLNSRKNGLFWIIQKYSVTSSGHMVYSITNVSWLKSFLGYRAACL